MLGLNRKAAVAIALAGLLGALASACLTVALLGANVLSTAVDRAPVRAHIAEAFAAGELDLRDHLRTDTKRGAHQYNDCLILLLIADERAPPLQRALSPLAAGVNDLGPCAALHEFDGVARGRREFRRLAYLALGEPVG